MKRSSEPQTSATLIRHLQDPIEGPFGWPRFVELYSPLILDWCRNKGLQEQDALDVAQEVMLTFSRQAARFRYDPSRAFRGYLRRLTHSAWCDWVERRAAWHKGAGNSAARPCLDRLPGREDPATRLGRDFDQERLEQAMRLVRDRVEPRTWEAFQLLAIEGEPCEMAAARLGMKKGSAYAARCKVQRLIRLELGRLAEERGES